MHLCAPDVHWQEFTCVTCQCCVWHHQLSCYQATKTTDQSIHGDILRFQPHLFMLHFNFLYVRQFVCCLGMKIEYIWKNPELILFVCQPSDIPHQYRGKTGPVLDLESFFAGASVDICKASVATATLTLPRQLITTICWMIQGESTRAARLSNQHRKTSEKDAFISAFYKSQFERLCSSETTAKVAH